MGGIICNYYVNTDNVFFSKCTIMHYHICYFLFTLCFLMQQLGSCELHVITRGDLSNYGFTEKSQRRKGDLVLNKCPQDWICLLLTKRKMQEEKFKSFSIPICTIFAFVNRLM